jgi:hypothetical protein
MTALREENVFPAGDPLSTNTPSLHIRTNHIPRYVDAGLSRSGMFRDDPYTSYFAGRAILEVSYLVRYLFLETENQRARPMLSEYGQSVMPVCMHPSKMDVERLLFQTSSPYSWLVFCKYHAHSL